MNTRGMTVSTVFCLLSLMAVPGWAQVVMVSTTRTTATTITSGSSGVLPLNNAGSTRLSSIFSGSKYLIHFHAECSVKANDDTTALRIAIVVDPGEPDEQVVSPTGLSTYELCTSIKPNPSQAAQHHRVSVGTSVLVAVSGHEFHEIEVRRQLSGFNAGEEAVIDELSLAVVAQ